MRAYFDTGPFIDLPSVHGNGILRTTDRRGRTPADLAMDAERLFEESSALTLRAQHARVDPRR
jgi:hypothetical protein